MALSNHGPLPSSGSEVLALIASCVFEGYVARDPHEGPMPGTLNPSPKP